MNRLALMAYLGLALLLSGCPELQHPPQGSSGATTTSNRQGNIVILFESQPVTQNLAQASRVLITIYCSSATLSGLPLQFEMSTNANPRPASLPTGYPLDITYDAFDSSNTFIGRGTTQTTLIKDQSSSIALTVTPVSSGTTYINPLTSTGLGAGLVPLTIDAIDPGTGTPLTNVLVALGSNANASQYTNLSGRVVTASTMPADLHLFYNGDAISVLGFSGSQITIPIGPDHKATVQGTFNPVPVLATNQSLEIYLSDGVQVATVNQALAGGGLYDRNVPAMIGPLGVTAVLHDNDPLATDPFPNMATPVNLAGPLDQTNSNAVTLSFPATPTPKIAQSVDIVRPNQLPSANNYAVDVWSLDNSGIPTPVANLDPGLTSVVTTPRWNGYIFTPGNGVNYRRHVVLNDAVNGGTTELWEEQTNPALFAPTVTPPDLPVLDPGAATTTPLLNWQLPTGANPDLVTATLTQGARRWTLFLLNPVGQTQLQIPPVSAGAFAPLQTGGGATDVSVALINWQPTMSWDPLSPDFLPHHWQPLSRATSVAITFSP